MEQTQLEVGAAASLGGWGRACAVLLLAAVLWVGCGLPARAAGMEWQTYLKEDFSGEESMFYTGQAGEAFYNIDDVSAYVINGLDTDSDSLSALTDSLYYYYVETACELRSSDAANLAFVGLVFHYKKLDDGSLAYYVFYIYGDGYYGAKRVMGDQVDIALPLTKSDEIAVGEPNLLGVEAQGSRFDLFINGRHVDGFTDLKLDGGGFGFYISKRSEGAFDDFVVKVEKRDTGQEPPEEPNMAEDGAPTEFSKYHAPYIPKDPNRPTYPWEVGVDKSKKGKQKKLEPAEDEAEPDVNRGEESDEGPVAGDGRPTAKVEAGSKRSPGSQGKPKPKAKPKQDAVPPPPAEEPPAPAPEAQEPVRGPVEREIPAEEPQAATSEPDPAPVIAEPAPAHDSDQIQPAGEGQDTDTDTKAIEDELDQELPNAESGSPKTLSEAKLAEPAALQEDEQEQRHLPAARQAAKDVGLDAEPADVPAKPETVRKASDFSGMRAKQDDWADVNSDTPVAEEIRPPANEVVEKKTVRSVEPGNNNDQLDVPEPPGVSPQPEPEAPAGDVTPPSNHDAPPAEPAAKTSMAELPLLPAQRADPEAAATPLPDTADEPAAPGTPDPSTVVAGAPEEPAQEPIVEDAAAPSSTPPAEELIAVDPAPEPRVVVEQPQELAPAPATTLADLPELDHSQAQPTPVPEPLDPPPAPDAGPSPVPVPDDPNLITLDDDFSEPRWAVATSETCTYRYFGAAYEIDNLNAATMALSFQQETLRDMEAVCDVEFLDGVSYVGHGIAARFSVKDGKPSYYGLFVCQSGEFMLLSVIGGKETVLAQWSPTPQLKPNQPNRIKLKLSGSKLHAYINDVLVGSVDDTTIQRGGYALLAGPGVAARFDNFSLRGTR